MEFRKKKRSTKACRKREEGKKKATVAAMEYM
jgi:hypothetical protein